MIIKCCNAYKMLSMVAVTMLLVSKHFVYELPFFPANPHGELCILSRSPKKSTCPSISGQSRLPGGSYGWGHPPQTAACVYAAKSPFWSHRRCDDLFLLSLPTWQVQCQAPLCSVFCCVPLSLCISPKAYRPSEVS